MTHSNTNFEQAVERIFAAFPATAAVKPPRDLPAPNLLRSAVRARWELPSLAQHRLRRHESADVRERDYKAWFRGALAAFVPTPICFVAVGPTHSVWKAVNTLHSADWLYHLAITRDHGHPEGHERSPIRSRWGDGVEDLTLLTVDGTRALLFATEEDEIFAFILPTSALLDRAQTLLQIEEAAQICRSIIRVTHVTFSPAVAVSALTNRANTARIRHLGVYCQEGDIEQGLTALLEMESPQNRARRENVFDVAGGTVGTLAWQTVHTHDRTAWVDQLWRRAVQPELYVSVGGDFILGLHTTPDGVDALIHRVEDVRAA
ncbi:MAG: hypothetical protein IPK82_35945 [Polyangiaceae bacterium]|nr:hypothetical protein [Polyangiaceae bacterium]